jgi:uncharacterized membrane protein
MGRLDRRHRHRIRRLLPDPLLDRARLVRACRTRVAGGAARARSIVAGEWTRRAERLARIAALPMANIPSILTAAGTAVAYADVWAAYGLYDFIGSFAAFVLLGTVALATLAAALLHGPALAGLGLVGAYARRWS